MSTHLSAINQMNAILDYLNRLDDNFLKGGFNIV